MDEFLKIAKELGLDNGQINSIQALSEYKIFLIRKYCITDKVAMIIEKQFYEKLDLIDV